MSLYIPSGGYSLAEVAEKLRTTPTEYRQVLLDAMGWRTLQEISQLAVVLGLFDVALELADLAVKENEAMHEHDQAARAV